MMYGLYIVQKGQAYHIFTPQGEQIGLLFMGYDGQYMKDAIAMRSICRVMSERWGIKQENIQTVRQANR